MLSIVKTMCLNGLEGYCIEVQVDITGGMPCFEIVGLPDTSIKESKERIKSAIKNSNIEFPSRRILVNLAPADVKKEGSGYDLPMAVGILIALEKINEQNVKDTVFIGELSLNGNINRINGILPMCIEALNLGIKRVIIPEKNVNEAGIVKGLEVIGVKNLQQVIAYLNNEVKIQPICIKVDDILKNISNISLDFCEVKGQENVKRALEIAAAGGHNCILIGSPGSRKNNDGKEITNNFAGLNI